MWMDLLLPLMSLPAVVLSLVGIWVLSGRRENDRGRRWLLFLWIAAIFLAIPLAVYADRIFTGDLIYALWPTIPSLIGILALQLLNMRRLYEDWQQDRVTITIVVLGLAFLFVFITLKDPFVLLALLFPAALLAGVWAFGRWLGVWGLAAAGAFLAVCFVLDAVGLIAHPALYQVPWLRVVYSVAGPIALVLGLISAALLIERGMQAGRTGDTKGAWLNAGLALVLILGIAGVMFRSGVLVKATGHAAEDHMPLGLVAVGVVVGLLLAFGLPERRGRLGLPYAVLVPTLIALAYAAGGLVDPEAVTIARAERIDQAISQYHQDTGAYPADLAALTPGYTSLLLGPLTGRGLNWCYEGGPDYYRLGYAYHQRYYGPTIPEPFSEVRIYYEEGLPPSGGWMCDQELEFILSTRGL
jgi:hypothetical protein